MCVINMGSLCESAARMTQDGGDRGDRGDRHSFFFFSLCVCVYIFTHIHVDSALALVTLTSGFCVLAWFDKAERSPARLAPPPSPSPLSWRAGGV